MHNLSLQFIGYYKTPVLWLGVNTYGLEQFDLETIKTPLLHGVFSVSERLGKRVESFVSFELKQHKNVAIIVENIQIQSGKRTLGELDCLLKKDGQLIHLEIVYKFYLYDASVGVTSIERWIGPNRKDSLKEKLVKLKEKQLPLLFKSETKEQLQAFSVSVQQIKQQVYFKAQLFVPYNQKIPETTDINALCIAGFYVSFKDLDQFKSCKFFMPSKLNWLQDIQIQTDWLTFTDFKIQLEPMIEKEISPLCWIKFPNGETSKCFVVWWI